MSDSGILRDPPAGRDGALSIPRIAALALAASVPLVAVAFWPAYLSRSPDTVDGYTHFHAVTGTLWLALLIAQPAAVHFGYYRLHRAVGRGSYVLAPLFALAGGLLSHHRLASMDDATFATDGFSHYLPFYATVAFVAAYALGLWHRRLPAAHGRFMLCTAVPLVDPVVGRILFYYFQPLPSPWLYQAVTFSIAAGIAGALVFSYRGTPPARRALAGFFALLLVLELGWFTVARTDAWLSAVGWFRALDLT